MLKRSIHAILITIISYIITLLDYYIDDYTR